MRSRSRQPPTAPYFAPARASLFSALQEDRREADFRLAARRWYENLSVADRFWEDERRKRVRREELAAMTPLERAAASMFDGMWTAALTRQLYSDRPMLWSFSLDPPAEALDDWLAEDGRVPEVAAALGL